MSDKVTVAVPAHDPVSLARIRAIVLIALVVGCFAFYWPTTFSLLEQWEDVEPRTYTHGPLIVCLSLWLLWRDRGRFATESHPDLKVGLGLLMLLGLAWLLAFRAGIEILHQALLPLLMLAAVSTCLGWRVTSRAWFPIAYLYFAIPVWDALNSSLQWISVFAVRFLLRLVGIPAYFDNNTFQIPAGIFEIAGGCSGLHFFVVALAIAVLYGEVHRDSLKVRIRLVALAAVFAMATNWIRIIIIIIAGHLTQMQHSLVSNEHYTFGWFMFAGAMFLYFLIVRRWPTGEVQESVQPARIPDGKAVRPAGAAALAVTGLALATFPAWLAIDRNRAEEGALAILPPHIVGWRTLEPKQTDWQPVFGGADRLERLTFDNADASVQVFSAAYAEQYQGKEVVGFDTSLLGPTLQRASREVVVSDGPWVELQATDSAGRRWLVRRTYYLDGQLLERPLLLQIRYAIGSLTGAPVAAVIGIRTECEQQCDAARSVLDEFSRSLSNRYETLR